LHRGRAALLGPDFVTWGNTLGDPDCLGQHHGWYYDAERQC